MDDFIVFLIGVLLGMFAELCFYSVRKDLDE